MVALPELATQPFLERINLRFFIYEKQILNENENETIILFAFTDQPGGLRERR